MKNYSNAKLILARIALSTVFFGSTISTTNLAQAETSSANISNQIAQTDRWTRQVRNQLNQAATAAGAGGLSLTHNPFIGDLGNGGRDDITLSLRSGVSYIIIGVCDEDCSDLDIAIYDDNGRLIASDVKKNDTPIVRISPRWNARFTIRVSMASCSSSPCRFGLGAYGK